MKRKRISARDRIAYLALSSLIWIILDVAIYIFFDSTLGIYGSGNSTARALMHGSVAIAFAMLQLRLMSHWLRLKPRRWLRWTFCAVVIGAVCHQLFVQSLPPPSEFWWHVRISPPPAAQDVIVANVYHGIRWFFRFGLVAFFQYLALPANLPGRRLWLIAAILTAPLWHTQQVLAVFIQAVTLVRLADSQERQAFGADSADRGHRLIDEKIERLAPNAATDEAVDPVMTEHKLFHASAST